jgi:hypothetical protein
MFLQFEVNFFQPQGRQVLYEIEDQTYKWIILQIWRRVQISRSESMTKYMFAFVNGVCHILQSISFPNLCYGWSFSATAITDLWESRVGQSAIPSEFQGDPENDAVVNEILLSESSEKSQAAKQVNKEGGGNKIMFLAVKNCSCFC